MTSPLEEAARAGFPVVLDPSEVRVDPRAARLLPPSQGAIAVMSAGGVLSVLLDRVPTPAEFRDLERGAGMSVTVTVAPSEVISALRATVSSPDTDAWVVSPILHEAVERGASDVHMAAGSSPVVRVNGILTPLDLPKLSATDMLQIASWVSGETIDESFGGDLDCALSFAGQRWRASIWKQRGSVAITLRLVPVQVPRLENLGLPVGVTQLADLTSGLVLFCGPTGSGKSTSMAALVDRINRSRSEHILTIEDPVEYVHRDQVSMVRQREVGSDTESFAVGLRAALRQDPDVILVGELRDLDTMQTALTAAETGHLVLATVHASSASQVVNRIVNSFPASAQDQVRQQLAASLQAVVSQILVPHPGGSRRSLICEVLHANSAVRNMIRDNRLHEITSVLDSSGTMMQSMDRALAAAVGSGMVDPDVAERYVTDQKAFEEFMRAKRPAPHLDDIGYRR